MSIASMLERNRLLKKTKEDLKTDVVTLKQEIQMQMNSLKVERDITEILEMYYDSGEYKEFCILYRPEHEASIFKCLKTNGITFLKLTGNKVHIQCQ